MENKPETELTVVKKNVLFEVTSFSRILAAILFIILPFVGGLIGYAYSKKVHTEIPLTQEIINLDTLIKTESNAEVKETSPEQQSKIFQTGVLFKTVDDTELSASIVFDKDLRKLVTNSKVTDNYYSQSFADTLVTSLPNNSTFVINIPQESIIFDQSFSVDGNVVYVSVLRTDKELTTEKNEAMGVFVYNISAEEVTFKMSAPAYSIIKSFSSIAGGELLSIATAGCYACGPGPATFYVIDLKTGDTPRYKNLGQLYSFKFVNDRTYTYTTPSYEECDGMGCINPGDTFTDSF